MARRGPDPALHRLRSAALDAAMRCIDVPAYLFDAAGAELARNPAGNSMHRARGFTLIEMMIVLAAAGVLATLGMLTSGKWFLAP